jgi:hypothetical protein
MGNNFMAKPIYVEFFYSDGRGPELARFCWSHRNNLLEAAEFMPSDAESSEDLRRVRFLRPQVVMVTPEEIINYAKLNYIAQYRPAAMFDLGKSDWLKSFSQQHLGKCSRYQFLFYDELLDVIAEGVEFGKGKFNPIRK